VGIGTTCAPAIQENTSIPQSDRIGGDLQVVLEPRVAFPEDTAKLTFCIRILRYLMQQGVTIARRLSLAKERSRQQQEQSQMARDTRPDLAHVVLR